jgi:palmitoyl-protein thioesterase
MGAVSTLIQDSLGDVHIHSVRIGENDDADKKSSFFGNVNEQLDEVCRQLKEDEALKGGFNAIGFSQGGQFLRAYVERCNDPPVHNLVTYGSQHMGISDLPGCADSSDWQCKMARGLALKGVYLPWVQKKVVQAQYFNDPNNQDAYLKQSILLPDINNAHPINSDDEDMPTGKNQTYKRNLSSLNKFVMIKFTEDVTVVPAETAWFGYYNQEGNVTSLQHLDIYKQDWIGLKYLDSKGKLIFEEAEGGHMQLSAENLQSVLKRHFANHVSKLTIQ